MITKDEIIYSLYKTVTSIVQSKDCFDIEGNPVAVDWSVVNQKVAEAQAEYDAKQYQRDRVTEYPAIGDQLDALWKGGDAAAEMLAKVQAVKAKYPKGA